MRGKHGYESIKIKQLEDVIKRRDEEIKDIKFSIADVLLEIRNLNESNDLRRSINKKEKNIRIMYRY